MVLSPEQSVFAANLRQQDGDPTQSTTPNSAQRTVVSILLFLLLMGLTSGDLTWVIAATVTIIIHELGHFLGMKMFGYKDVRMFLVPFFGGLATGKKHAPSAMEQAIVLLLGPLPGLLIAVIMSFTIQLEFVVHAVDERIPWFAMMLLELRGTLCYINQFNLLPLMPLDGGRLMQLMVVGRNAWLMLVFALLSSIGMLLFCFLAKAWILAAFAGFGLIGMLFSAKQILLAAKVRKRLAGISSDLTILSDRDCRILDFLARKISPEAKTDDRVLIARNLHEEIVAKPLSHGEAITVILLYLAGWAMAFVVSAMPARFTMIHPQAK